MSIANNYRIPLSKAYTNHAIIEVDADRLKDTIYPKSAAEMVASARAAFRSGKTRSLYFRKTQLRKLHKLLEDNAALFEEALAKDLGRHKQETASFDLDYTKFDVEKIISNLYKWAKTEQAPKPAVNMLDKVAVHNDPYGVVLIMGAWNFPVNLVFVPFAGAIAAGNCVIIKPSEMAGATAKVISDLVPKYLDDDCYYVYNGGVAETTILLEERFDYIFFTGSTTVGKIVHSAANKYLTPVTLELGGKSPVYLDDSADVELAARRILWGKCSNAGQICIAPDYLLCTREVQKVFVAAARKILHEWYGKDVKASPFFCRLISDKHFQRLSSFLKDKKLIALGGQMDANQRFIEPTVLVDVSPNHPVMQEEIFGPILPIVTVESAFEGISFINAREKPLALYLFSNNREVVELFLNNTSSGGVAINDTIMHFVIDSLPFGGVGFSGMGAYHGKASFDTFVHKKGVLHRKLNGCIEKGLSVRYPPYTESKMKMVYALTRPRRGLPCSWRPILMFLLGVCFVLGVQMMYHCLMDKDLY